MPKPIPGSYPLSEEIEELFMLKVDLNMNEDEIQQARNMDFDTSDLEDERLDILSHIAVIEKVLNIK